MVSLVSSDFRDSPTAEPLDSAPSAPHSAVSSALIDPPSERTKARKRAPTPPPSCAHVPPQAAHAEEPATTVDSSDVAWSSASDDLNTRLDRREMIEQLLELADLLKPADRALLRGVFGSGMSPADMAAAMEQQTRQVRTRIRKLLRHLAKPVFKLVAREHSSWPNNRKSVARAVVLQRASQREAARELGITLHRVRRELDRIRGIVDDALGVGSLKISAHDDADHSGESAS